MDKIIDLSLPEKCRILAVSDIHTHWQLFDRLLKKAKYDPQNDYLVIVGDILEHGSDNIKTLEYVKALCDKSDKAILLMGNNDIMCSRMAYHYDFDKFVKQFYRNEHNTFRQMANTLGYVDCWVEQVLDDVIFIKDGSIAACTSVDEIREKVVEKYGELLSFIRELPTCLETEEYVFVHAGLENRPDWRNTDDIYAITVPWFLRKENPTGKQLVFGHYPTYNYKRSNVTNLPIIDSKKKMICIDGGMTIKKACQMNLFIIDKCGENYSHRIIWDTDVPKKTVLKDFSCDMKPVYIDWEKQDITIIEKNGYMTKVRDEYSEGEGLIPDREIYFFDEKPHVYQFLSSFPAVRKGERVSVFDEDETMSLVITENATVGWLPSDIIE